MKYIFLMLITMSVNLNALEYEVGSSYLHIEQDLFGTIEFDMKAIGINVAAWHESGFGVKILIAKSSESENSISLDDKYTNKIDDLISTSILYKYDFGDLSLLSGIGYTKYKTTWSVNGSNDFSWVNDTDSDISYVASIRYSFNDHSQVEFGYNNFYRKNKAGYGKEKTTGFNVGIVYKF